MEAEEGMLAVMSPFDIFQYKVENFVNRRCLSKQFGSFFYIENGEDRYSISTQGERGRSYSMVRWFDVYPKNVLQQIIVGSLGYSGDDYGAIIVLLSRLGFLLAIDNGRRINKDLFLIFYVIQLISLKNDGAEREGDINYFLRSFCVELMMDYDAYVKFFVKGNRLFFKSDTLGDVEFKDVLKSLYGAIERRGKRLPLSRKLADFQTSMIEFLFSSDRNEYALGLNDRNEYLIYPKSFFDAYKRSRRKVFQALADCFDEDQSDHNLLVSNLIIMNYSYYVLRRSPRAVLLFKKYIDCPDIFSKLISTLVYRGVAVDKKMFSGLGVDECFLSHPLRGDESIRLFNLTYTVRRGHREFGWV